MDITNITGNVAEIETDYGTYWISFETDGPAKIRNATITDYRESEPGRVAETEDIDSLPDEQLIVQHAISLIEEALHVNSDGVEDDEEWDDEEQADDSSNEIEFTRLVVVAKKNPGYVVKLEQDVAQDERILFVITSGDNELLGAMRKPLNTLVSSYCRTSKEPDHVYLENLLGQLMSGISPLWDHESVTANRVAQERKNAEMMPKIERCVASLWASFQVLKCVDAIANIMLKRFLSDSKKSRLFKVSVQARQRLDLVRFKSDYPDLYQQYLMPSTTTVLTKTFNPVIFPLDESQIREQVAAAIQCIDVAASSR